MTAQNPSVFDEQQLAEISQKIAAKGAAQTCPSCGQRAGLNAIGYGLVENQIAPGPIGIGQGFEVLNLLCNNCGFLTQLSIGHLGITR